MLSWRITITAADVPDTEWITRTKYPTLASWQVGADGLEWMDKLLKKGRAVRVWKHGYPHRYKSTAQHILPLLTSGGVKADKGEIRMFGVKQGEEYGIPPRWMGELDLDRDVIAACARDQVLTITAWDQS